MSQSEFIEDTSSQVGCLRIVQVQDVFHVRTWVEVLYNYRLALHLQMLRVEEFSTECAHGLKCDVTRQDDMLLFA